MLAFMQVLVDRTTNHVSDAIAFIRGLITGWEFWLFFFVLEHLACQEARIQSAATRNRNSANSPSRLLRYFRGQSSPDLWRNRGGNQG
jgi:hypothetical protein